MPTLHLPAAHTDADVALAIEVAGVVGSHELYVAWTHGEGPGLPPEIETTIAEPHAPNAVSPFAEVIVAMVQGISALWNAIAHPPSTKPELPPAESAEPTPRSAAEEPRA
jgi:hypothetical protein